MPAMTDRLPLPLSERIASATQNIYSRQGREVDVAIGGVPFRLATSAELPHTIETIPVRKDQVDTETDPGEQSLAGWWRRAQASWHEGAGYLYQESLSDLTPSNGFFDSEGVDVFTQGRITLLRKMLFRSNSGWKRIRSFGTGYSVINGNGNVYKGTPNGGNTSNILVPPGGAVDAVVNGGWVYAVTAAGTLYQWEYPTVDAGTTWPCGATPSRLGWGKHRLWIIGGRKLWQPDLSLAGGTAQNPIFTHPNQGWNYTCMTEGLTAMYFGGHDEQSSTIQAVTLDSGGGLPTLTGAAVTAALPDGELVQEIQTLAGDLIGIGTSRGFRVGRTGADGAITYGPLLIEPTGVTACTALTTQGRFFLVAFATPSGTAKAYRVDTGTELDTLVFPYASDIDTGVVGNINSLAAVGNQVVATVSNGDQWYQHATQFVASGYIQSGRIRYRTTERKFFHSLAVEHEPLNGNISMELIREGGGTQAIGSLTTPGMVSEAPYLIDGEAIRFGSVKFTLTPNTANTAAPVLNSYQLTSYPAVPPQRLVTLPLLCFDKEKSHSGQWYGGQGFAADRLAALQTVENQQELVTFQDFTLGNVGQLALIERVRFVQTAPATSQNGPTGPGGIIVLELRTVDGT